MVRNKKARRDGEITFNKMMEKEGMKVRREWKNDIKCRKQTYREERFEMSTDIKKT